MLHHNSEDSKVLDIGHKLFGDVFQVYLNSGNFTILTTDPLYEHTIGQRVQLSFQDAKILNLAYCNGRLCCFVIVY